MIRRITNKRAILIALSILLVGALSLKAEMAKQKPFQLVILCYHHVGLKTDNRYSVPVQTLARQIDILRENGFSFIRLKDVADHYHYKKNMPPRSVVITFDDGGRSVYTEAWPLLRKKNVPFSVFVYPSGISAGQRKGFMNWPELREMSNAGVEIGCHSYNHPFLTKYATVTSPESWLDTQLATSRETLEKELGCSINYFAVPYGVWDKVVYKKLKTSDYKLVLNVNGTNNDQFSDPYDLPRQVVFSEESEKIFKDKTFSGRLNIANEFPQNLSVITTNNIMLRFQPAAGNFILKDGSLYLNILRVGKIYPEKNNGAYVKKIILPKPGFYLVNIHALSESGKKLSGSWSFVYRRSNNNPGAKMDTK